MLLKLNLLPPQIKEALKQKRVQKRIIWIIVVIYLTTALIGGGLFLGKYFLRQELRHIEAAIDIEEPKEEREAKEKLKGSVNDFNELMGKISEIQKGRILWSRFFQEVFGKIPDGIQLKSIKINAQGGITEISGEAKTRNEVLALEDYLRKNSKVKNLEYPLSNLIDRANVEFEFKFVLEKNEEE